MQRRNLARMRRRTGSHLSNMTRGGSRVVPRRARTAVGPVDTARRSAVDPVRSWSAAGERPVSAAGPPQDIDTAPHGGGGAIRHGYSPVHTFQASDVATPMAHGGAGAAGGGSAQREVPQAAQGGHRDGTSPPPRGDASPGQRGMESPGHARRKDSPAESPARLRKGDSAATPPSSRSPSSPRRQARRRAPAAALPHTGEVGARSVGSHSSGGEPNGSDDGSSWSGTRDPLVVNPARKSDFPPPALPKHHEAVQTIMGSFTGRACVAMCCAHVYGAVLSCMAGDADPPHSPRRCRFSPLEPYPPRDAPKRAFPPIIRALSSLLAAHASVLANANAKVGQSVMTPRTDSDGTPRVPRAPSSSSPRPHSSMSGAGWTSGGGVRHRKGLSAAAAAAAVVAVAGSSQRARRVAQARVREAQAQRTGGTPHVAGNAAAAMAEAASWQRPPSLNLAQSGFVPGPPSGGASRKRPPRDAASVGGRRRSGARPRNATAASSRASSAAGTRSGDGGGRSSSAVGHGARGRKAAVNRMARVYTGNTVPEQFSPGVLGPAPRDYMPPGYKSRARPSRHQRSRSVVPPPSAAHQRPEGGSATARPQRAGTSLGIAGDPATPGRFLAREPDPVPQWEGAPEDNPVDMVVAWKRDHPEVFGPPSPRGHHPPTPQGGAGSSSVASPRSVRSPRSPRPVLELGIVAAGALDEASDPNATGASSEMSSATWSPQRRRRGLKSAYRDAGRPGLSNRRLEVSHDAMVRGVAVGGTWDGDEFRGASAGADPINGSFIPPHLRRHKAAAARRARASSAMSRSPRSHRDADARSGADVGVGRQPRGDKSDEHRAATRSVTAGGGEAQRTGSPQPGPMPPAGHAPATRTPVRGLHERVSEGQESQSRRANRPTRPGRPRRPAFMLAPPPGGMAGGVVLGMGRAFGATR